MKKRRVLAVFLALVMLLSILPMSVFAAGVTADDVCEMIGQTVFTRSDGLQLSVRSDYGEENLFFLQYPEEGFAYGFSASSCTVQKQGNLYVLKQAEEDFTYVVATFRGAVIGILISGSDARSYDLQGIYVPVMPSVVISYSPCILDSSVIVDWVNLPIPEGEFLSFSVLKDGSPLELEPNEWLETRNLCTDGLALDLKDFACFTPGEYQVVISCRGWVLGSADFTVEDTPIFDQGNGYRTVEMPEDITLTGEEDDPYELMGWYTTKTGGTQPESEFHPGETYYAHWRVNVADKGEEPVYRQVLTFPLTVKADGLYVDGEKTDLAEYGIFFDPEEKCLTLDEARIRIFGAFEPAVTVDQELESLTIYSSGISEIVAGFAAAIQCDCQNLTFKGEYLNLETGGDVALQAKTVTFTEGEVNLYSPYETDFDFTGIGIEAEQLTFNGGTLFNLLDINCSGTVLLEEPDDPEAGQFWVGLDHLTADKLIVNGGRMVINSGVTTTGGIELAEGYYVANGQLSEDGLCITVREGDEGYASVLNELYTIRFEELGLEEIYRAGDLIREPEAPEKDGYRFGGWFTSRRFDRAWNFAAETVAIDRTFYSLWIPEKNAVLAEVQVEPAEAGIRVQLYQGYDKLADGVTDETGLCSLGYVPRGEYNLIVSGGDRSMVEWIRMDEEATQRFTVGLEENHRWDIGEGEEMPRVIVNGLKDVTLPEIDPALQYNAVMEIYELDDDDEAEQMIRLTGARELSLMELSLLFFYNGVDSEGWEVFGWEEMTEVDRVLEFEAPYNTNRGEVEVYRMREIFEGMQLDCFTRIDQRPTDPEDYVDGTYYVGNGYVVFYAQQLGAVGIGYAENSGDSRYPLPEGCAEDGSCSHLAQFEDLNDENLWYLGDVHYCVENGLMQGVAPDRFAAEDVMTRAMVVEMLYRMEGEPPLRNANVFTDVAQGAWYEKAVVWAQGHGIVDGYGDGCFGPEDPVTREQLATILYRYALYKGFGFQGPWSFTLSYSDKAAVSYWAYEAVCWCTMTGILTGNENNEMDPSGMTTRAEAAAMFRRFCEQ